MRLPDSYKYQSPTTGTSYRLMKVYAGLQVAAGFLVYATGSTLAVGSISSLNTQDQPAVGS